MRQGHPIKRMESEETVELSSNNIARIEKILGLAQPTFLIEYGSGNSTLFWIKKLKGRQSGLVSVECNEDWYEKVCGLIDAQYKSELELLEKSQKRWSLGDCVKYLLKKSETWVHIPKNKTRIGKAKKRVLKRFLGFLVGKNPIQNRCRAYRIGKMIVEYVLITEFIKDQYGESPFVESYINAGLTRAVEYFTDKSDTHFIFLVDGGPRAHIVLAITELEKTFPNMNITIILLDAWRGFYEKVFSKHTGQFFKGNNRLPSGEKHIKTTHHIDEIDWYWEKGSLVKAKAQPRLQDGQLPRDMWVYSNTFRKEINALP